MWKQIRLLSNSINHYGLMQLGADCPKLRDYTRRASKELLEERERIKNDS